MRLPWAEGREGCMTEAEWYACKDPRALLPSLDAHGSQRKQWLFACACCRAVWHPLPAFCREALEAVERYADGTATDDELFAIFESSFPAPVALPFPGGAQATEAVSHLGWRWRWGGQSGTLEYTVRCVSRSAAEATAK